jgi:CarD family transcriptional regulator
MFETGDIVAHAHHGIGTIKKTVEAEIMGSRQTMVTVHFEREDLEFTTTPRRLEASVRSVLDDHQARAILTHLAKCDRDLASEYKVRHRNNQNRLTSGDPYKLCDVIAGLRRLRRKKGSLSRTDSEHLRRATGMLSEELALALDCAASPQAIEEELLLATA